MTDTGRDGDTSAAGGQTASEDILDRQVRRGVSELERPLSGLSLSALSAGLDIGFGPLLMVVVLSAAAESGTGPLGTELLLGLVYGVGFILVVVGRSELFTEHTTLAVLPVLDGQASLWKLGRLWAAIYIANIVGAALFTLVAVAVGPGLGVTERAAFFELASRFTEQSAAVLFGAGIFAGWLMGLLSWLVAAADSTSSRIAVVWIIAAAIGFANLPHCIAGTVEVLGGVLVSPALHLVDYARFLVLSTLGNVVGGTVFVALLNYGHVVRSGPPLDEISRD